MGGRFSIYFHCKTLSFDVNAEPYRCSKRHGLSVWRIANRPYCLCCLTSAGPVVIRAACIRHTLKCMSCSDTRHGQH